MTVSDPFAPIQTVEWVNPSQFQVGQTVTFTYEGQSEPKPAMYKGAPKYWGNQEPVMRISVFGTRSDGVKIGVGVELGGALHRAIRQATTRAGATLAEGGKLTIKYQGKQPTKGGNMAHSYAAKYEPGQPPAPKADPWAESSEEDLPF